MEFFEKLGSKIIDMNSGPFMGYSALRNLMLRKLMLGDLLDFMLQSLKGLETLYSLPY